MKSTPEQTEKRQELKRLVEKLGAIAWHRFPEVAPCGIVPNRNSLIPDAKVITYDEFLIIQHETKAIPAKATGGKIFLRFRRRITRNQANFGLWHVWQPEYAATKPETVDELLPVIRAHLDEFTKGKTAKAGEPWSEK